LRHIRRNIETNTAVVAISKNRAIYQRNNDSRQYGTTTRDLAKQDIKTYYEILKFTRLWQTPVANTRSKVLLHHRISREASLRDRNSQQGLTPWQVHGLHISLTF